MPNIELKQINLVQVNCVNLSKPAAAMELNIQMTHNIDSSNAGLLTTSTKIDVAQKEPDITAPLSISFELRAIFQILSDLSQENMFKESADVMFPFIQSYLLQCCTLLGGTPIYLPVGSLQVQLPKA